MFENLLIFGAHDSNMYCLDQEAGNVLWTFKMTSQIYSSPSLIQLSGTIFVIGISSDGYFALFDLRNGNALLTKDLFDMKDSCFSSPVANREKIYIGARNNYIYSFELQ